jgi:D-threo-aldose 1-dehydrogenase
MTLIFGTAPLGLTHYTSYAASDTDALTTLQYAYDQGIRAFDTAPKYQSEKRLGLFVQRVPRHTLYLQTKVCSPISTTPADPTRAGIWASLQRSLQLLHTDYVDSLLVHDPLPNYDLKTLENILLTLMELRARGLTRAIGIGQMYYSRELLHMLEKLSTRIKLDHLLLANDYNLLTRAGLPLLDYCYGANLPVQLGAPYAGGILAGGAWHDYQPAEPQTQTAIANLTLTAQRASLTLPAYALQFCLAHPAVHALVIGMATPAEITTNLNLLQGLQKH